MFVKERNIQDKEPEAVEFTSAEVQKKQHNEWVDVPQHQQSLSVKPEPGFLQSYPYMPALVSHPQHDQPGDGLGLLRHEDKSIYSIHRTCPNDLTVHLARVTTGRVPYFDQIPRPGPRGGRMLPSLDQVPRPVPGRQPASSFEERPLADVMFDMYEEQLQHSEAGTLDNIW